VRDDEGSLVTLIAYADGADGPCSSPAVVAAAAGVEGTPEVLLGWVVQNLPWLADPSVAGRTTMAGYALAPAVGRGQLAPISIRLSGVPSLLHHLRPDVGVVAGIRRGERLVYGQTVGIGPALTAASARVVVEIDESAHDLGGPEITGNIVATLTRPAADLPAVVARAADDVDLRIGALVASLLPDEPTLQFGPGGIGEGIARALKRPVSIWSGLVTDTMAALADSGLLRGPITAAYAWGGEPIRVLAAAGLLRLVPVGVTHDISAIAAIPRFVGCNTALQVGLDGSINIERIGSRLITSIGGHADFCAGASRSPGGMSIIALRATTPKGASTIVRKVDTVSTPRCDVSIVVTEHGIADLRGVGDPERSRRIAAVAAPEHRDALADQAS
jgi:acyl-CoA hydrolase